MSPRRLVGSLGVAASQVLPRWYQASARLAVMPAHDPSMSASLEAVQSATEMMPMLIAILQSHGLDEETTKRLGLENAYRTRTFAAAVAELHGRIHVTAERKADLVTVLVDDTMPERGARDRGRGGPHRARATECSVVGAQPRRSRPARGAARRGRAARSAPAEDALEHFREQNRVVESRAADPRVGRSSGGARADADRAKLGERFALGFGSGQSPEARRSHRARRDIEAELDSF